MIQQENEVHKTHIFKPSKTNTNIACQLQEKEHTLGKED
jgi:hypothetical protein